MILIPDACVGPWSWAWVVEALGGAVQTVVYRPAPPASAEGVDSLVADLEAILGEMSVRQAHLVGCGLGGQVALAYAHEYQRSRSLLLLGTGTDGPAGGPQQERLFASDPLDGLRPYLGKIVEQLDADQIREWRQQDDPTANERRRQIAAATAFESPPLFEVTTPTRICHGTDDMIWPPDQGRELASELPRASFETVLDAPHLLPVAMPRLVVDELVGIVEQVEDEPVA